MLVTVSRAAKELGLSLKTARTKIRRGEWPVYSFGSKATRVDLAEIKKLVRKPAREIDWKNAA